MNDLRIKVLAADPPWCFADECPGEKRSASSHYDVLSTQAIEIFPLPELADDAILFLWRVAAMPSEAISVARAWGFEPKSELVWVKTRANAAHVLDADHERVDPELAFGMGHYVRAAHETCLIAARGRGASLITNRSVRSVFFAPRGAHSAKPNSFYTLVETLCEGPYAELFARRPRAGWLQFGNQLEGRPAAPERRGQFPLFGAQR